MAVNHYENFPVASFLLPARLRPAVRALYTFARSADDIADEGDANDEQRIAGLNSYAAQLAQIKRGDTPDDAQFQVLQQTIAQYQLPIQPLYQLLSAFKQDVVKKRYANYAELLDYCDRSANPVGNLILHLYGAATPQNLHDSDAICSALQLINFWQDVAIDWQKQRIYIPLDDMQRFGVSEQTIGEQICDPAWRALMQFEVQRTRELMLSGSQLACRLPGRIGLELRAVVQGGLRILEKIELKQENVFQDRPKLNKWDSLVIAWRVIWM
ncbi:squalene synthase HpnC [Solimicrobium silvestre]|uniref:HpnC: squalene synthase HpnC n=1 Tax=Solimicrobium silvestre TaxID=2099400 RepID=A0A2S9GTZ2_9BURK|nr:squalene synthase HpnC [Solimicrobium silvestre]PRC91205.1 HpnC: squalene synthase HpnC [Solimicrobium silvestre]